jgi:uncharacterized membrane protein SpoIIM required for sporulation
MIQPVGRRERVLVVVWIIIGIVVWNGVYDFVMFRGVQAYLFRNALHELGRAPDSPMKLFMDNVIYDAVWIATLWSGAILLAGLLTIRSLSRARLKAEE